MNNSLTTNMKSQDQTNKFDGYEFFVNESFHALNFFFNEMSISGLF
jgi:hypothetical protein